MKRFTSTISFAAVVLALSIAQAHPASFEGTYSFKGHVEPQGRLTVDVIDTRFPDAAKRLEDVRAQGATCEPQAGTVIRCSKMWNKTHVAQTSLQKIAERNRGFFVSFAHLMAPPTLVSEGDSVSEWRVKQSGEWSGDRFASYRYLWIRNVSGDMAKLFLEGTHSTLELLTNDARTLGKFDSTVVTESRWRWHVDYATVTLEK